MGGVMEPSTNETMVKFNEQTLYYIDSVDCESSCNDTLNMMQRYLRTLFCRLKFLSKLKFQFMLMNWMLFQGGE
jgi:hypothetical protein